MVKAWLFVSVFVSLMLFGLWFYERKMHFEAIQKLATCKSELQATQENLNKYIQLYTDLRSECEMNKKQIEQKYSKLLQKSLEPIPQIAIPKTEDECQALKEMIDEAISHLNDK